MCQSLVACLLFCLALGCQVGLAQEADGSLAGRRARVSAPSLQPDDIIGTVVEMSDSALVLDVVGRGLLTFSPEDITRLQVSRGSGHAGATGAKIGALAGTALFVAAALVVDRCDAGCTSIGEYALVFAGIATPSIGLGFIIGRRFRRERWVDMPTGWSVGLRLRPQHLSGRAF